MRWENDPPSFPILPDSEIPTELLDGLERLSRDARPLKVRFRWRPRLSAATGYLTKNRLLDLEADTIVEIARAVASYAKHLYDPGVCENRFEAQVHREFLQLGEDGRTEREWRSVTFYVDDPNHPISKVATQMDPNFDDGEDDVVDEEDDDEGDEGDESDEEDDDHTRTPSPRIDRHRLRAQRPGRARSRDGLTDNYADYGDYIKLSRTDPVAFAMLVTERSHNKTVTLLERLLYSSVDRLDRVQGSQVSSTRYINEALQTLTKGAADIAGLGLSLFQSGLEGQARVARMEHESELGKERTELMRDAVKQGSLLIQAVLMSNAAKRRQANEPQPVTRTEQRGAAPPLRVVPSPPQQGPTVAAPPASAAAPPAEPPREPAPAPVSESDRDIEARTRRLLELLSDDDIARARIVAPTVVSVFELLRSGPLDAAFVRQVIQGAEKTVDRSELSSISELLDAEVVSTFGGLLMRVLSEGM